MRNGFSRSNRQILAIAGMALAALMVGAGASTLHGLGVIQLPKPSQKAEQLPPSLSEDHQRQTSAVLPLVSKSPQARADQLQAIAQTSSPSQDQLRARYLLAVDLIEQNRGGAALPLLDNLDQQYPLLAAPILAKRAQAYTASGQPDQASATWQELLKRYPESPVAAEALFALGKQDRQYWQQAIAQFPAHPRTLEIAQTLLQENPNQPQLLLVLARYGVDLPEITAVLDRLTKEYTAQLSPQDWEAIAFAYWETMNYNKAGKAYANAPRTPLNLFRTGRGAQLGKRHSDAIAAYQQLVQAYPDAPESGNAFMRLSQLVQDPQQRLAYLDTVMQKFPDRAGDALLRKAEILDAQNSPQAASQARQMLLSRYGQSDAAAELRWTLAERRIEAGDIKGAWELARQIAQQNPDSTFAPEAAFWIGKWAQQAGQQQAAKQAYEYVLSRYPHSYYAWRSAAKLGWDVGDFTTVRTKLPQVSKPAERPTPPVGSATLRELYQLGQDWDAWALWQVEFQNRMQPTVVEQFTDGLMRLGVGDNLDGIFMVSSLARRETAEEKEQYKRLKQDPLYWQALYPFPYLELINSWSSQRQLNPLLVTALIRQESRFEAKIESSAGAKGLMQVMPSTADWIASKISLQDFDLEKPEDNVKLGTWYLDYTHQEYDNNSLFAVASYNAGPGAVADWIQRFGYSDPDWFVEQIPFPETKGYVESVFENYWNYLRLYNPQISAQLARYAPKHVGVSP
ncbi:MAG TPA: transglycosylase SLT domain-containing protein [Synechococcales cyanobacterium M55_K2018_004]|nr:transglycosylase SLT domain-containing protein [Synechococcales cyanobacterium M55_K2018_004]